MIYILAYGSLRPGNYNHDRFGHGVLKVKKTNVTIKGYKMYDLGSYPCITNTENEEDSIICDILSTNDKNIVFAIDAMEIGAGYTSEPVLINDINCKLYTMPPENFTKYNTPIHVESGNWNSYNKITLN